MEPAGLVVGVVGLAGLFSACIDCFELVQRGRYHGKDYLLLETKYTNQRLRLTSWGRACGFLDPDGIDDRLEDEQTTAAIKATLVHLKTLSHDGQKLRSKYGLKHDRTTQSILALVPASFGALVPSNFPSKVGLGQKFHELRQSTRMIQKNTKLGIQARWAIEDRSKFMDLIRDLKDLIDGLEGLTRWLSVPERQHRNIEIEVESILDLSTLKTMEEARLGRIDAVADAASVRLWQLRDQFLEPIQVGTSNATIVSHPTSLTSLEDGWEDVIPEELQLHQGDDNPICYQILYMVCCAHEPTSIFLDIPLYSHSNGGDS